MIPHKCPVCHGYGFITCPYVSTSTFEALEVTITGCSSCNGAGVVWNNKEEVK